MQVLNFEPRAEQLDAEIAKRATYALVFICLSVAVVVRAVIRVLCSNRVATVHTYTHTYISAWEASLGEQQQSLAAKGRSWLWPAAPNRQQTNSYADCANALPVRHAVFTLPCSDCPLLFLVLVCLYVCLFVVFVCRAGATHLTGDRWP